MPCCQLTALNCVWSVIEKEHSYISSQKEKRNSLFPCIQVKNSLADFIISTVFLKGCFILLGEQKEQNNSLPLRSSQHLLRGSPNYHYWNWKCLPNLCPGRWGEDIQGFIHTKSSSNQAGPLPLNRQHWEVGQVRRGKQLLQLHWLPRQQSCPMSCDGHISNVSHRVYAQQRQLWGFHCWEEKLVLYQCWPKWRGAEGDGVKKHLWLHWG